MRIVRKRYKALYIVGTEALLFAIDFPLRPYQAQIWPLVLGELLFLAQIAIAVRSFRGARELVDPPRPWWRMTGGSTSGIVLGIAWSLGAVSGALDAADIPRPHVELPAANHVDLAVGVVLYLVLAVLYFRSSARLRREPLRPLRVDPLIVPAAKLD